MGVPSLRWLSEVLEPPWDLLAEASRSNFPVPNGFVVPPAATEDTIRRMYEEMKIREKTHYVAVRGAEAPFLNLLGGDRLIHIIRSCWQNPGPVLLVQRMVNSLSCGTTRWEAKRLEIEADRGLIVFEPDIYFVDRKTLKCVRRTIRRKQKQLVRWLDGTTRIVENASRKAVLRGGQIQELAELAVGAKNCFGQELNLSWAIDERKVWVISLRKAEGRRQ